MNDAKILFDESYTRIKNIHSLYLYLTEQSNFKHEIVEDLLRSEIVGIVSALDKFISDVIVFGVMDCFRNSKNKLDALSNLKLTFLEFNLYFLSTSDEYLKYDNLEKLLRTRLKQLTFQEPEKIANGLSFFWNEPNKWKKISVLMNQNEKSTKIKLKNIVTRRNQIVHEADHDLYNRCLQPITPQYASESVEYINNLVDSIFKLINSTD